MLTTIDSRLTALVLRAVPIWCKPNHITGVRILLIPLIWAFYYEASPWVATAMFILLALTDFVDGRVARARNLVTRKGKVFDIICDQVLLWSTVWLLIREDIISFSQSPVLFWALIVIMFREISVTAVRLFAKIKAGDVRVLILGKCKTGFFMVGLAALLTSAVWPVGSKLGVILLGIAALCSFFSGLQYIHQFVSKPSSSLR